MEQLKLIFRCGNELCLAKIPSGSKLRLLFAVKAHKSQLWDTGKFLRHSLISIIRCSQICACQSTEKQQESTGFGPCVVTNSIKSS